VQPERDRAGSPAGWLEQRKPPSLGKVTGSDNQHLNPVNARTLDPTSLPAQEQTQDPEGHGLNLLCAGKGGLSAPHHRPRLRRRVYRKESD
jgi:hypothetical protein